jgi:hypothetical protein
MRDGHIPVLNVQSDSRDIMYNCRKTFCISPQLVDPVKTILS